MGEERKVVVEEKVVREQSIFIQLPLRSASYSTPVMPDAGSNVAAQQLSLPNGTWVLFARFRLNAGRPF